MYSDNASLKFLGKLCKYQSISNMGKNVIYLMQRLNIEFHNVLQCHSKESAHNLCYLNTSDRWHKQQDAMDINTAKICAELIDARDGLLECVLAKSEIKELLTHFCVN